MSPADVHGKAVDRRSDSPVSRRVNAVPADRPYICVLGVYGKGNIGDEALLAAIADAVRETLGDVDVVVFGSDAVEVERRFSIPAVSRAPFPGFRAKLKVLRKAEAIVLGGGTLLCDHGGFFNDLRAVASVFFWPFLGRMLGVPGLVYAQGLGPVTEWPVRLAVRHLLTRMTAISLRDRRSAELLQAITGSARTCPVTCDPVVAAERFQPDVISAGMSGQLRETTNRLTPYCIVSFRSPAERPHNPERYYMECGEALGDYHAEHRIRFVLFPALLSDTSPDDRIGLEILERSLVQRGVPGEDISWAGWDDLDEGVALLQHARVAVGDRLHALLFAAMAGVPVIAIDIEDKIPGCLEMIACGRLCAVFSPLDVKSRPFIDALHAARLAGDPDRRQLRQRVSRWASEDSRNRALLADVVDLR